MPDIVAEAIAHATEDVPEVKQVGASALVLHGTCLQTCAASGPLGVLQHRIGMYWQNSQAREVVLQGCDRLIQGQLCACALSFVHRFGG